MSSPVEVCRVADGKLQSSIAASKDRNGIGVEIAWQYREERRRLDYDRRTELGHDAMLQTRKSLCRRLELRGISLGQP